MIKKMIIVEDCTACPLVSECKEFKKLTPKQRVYIMTYVGLKNAILKTCPLENAPVSEMVDKT